MTKYKNLSTNSGVSEYEIQDEGIIVRFKTGSTYLYTYGSTKQNNIETMKKLAISGKGLSSFISKVIKKSYASKLK